MELERKKFIAVPADAMGCLLRRYATLAEATEAATTDVGETGVSVYVVELKAVAARADRPVKVTKL